MGLLTGTLPFVWHARMLRITPGNHRTFFRLMQREPSTSRGVLLCQAAINQSMRLDDLVHEVCQSGRCTVHVCSTVKVIALVALLMPDISPPIIPTPVTWTEGMYSGGTPEVCASANAAAWSETLQFLSQYLT